MGEHRQVGVVACASADAYLADEIRKHEKTRPDKEDDLNIELQIGKPSGPPFVNAYIQGDSSVAEYFNGSWLDPESYRGMLESIDRRFDADARCRALEAMNTRCGVGQDRLDHWVEEDGLMVTTGQQPGLMGGPLYSLYKGLTTVR